MRRSFSAALALGAVLVLASCGDDPAPTQAPRAGAPQLYLAPTPTAIIGQINLLFVAGTPRDGALSQFDNVFRKKEAGDDRAAQRLALNLINFVIQKYKSRELLDPAGPFVSPTTREAVADLVRAIYEYAFETAIDEEDLRDMLGLSTYTQVVGPTGAVILEPDVFLLDIPAGALCEDKLVSVKQLPNKPVPLPQTLGPTYPFYMEFTITPELNVTPSCPPPPPGETVGRFQRLVKFGFCTTEAINGGAPAESYDRLRAGHKASDGTFELLPRIEDGRLFCAGQSEIGMGEPSSDGGLFGSSLAALGRGASRAWSLFAPTPAYAGHSGLTSLLGSQDTFGAVDPGAGPADMIVTFVNESPSDIEVGFTTELQAEVRTAGGDFDPVAVEPQPTITWSSSDPAIASVSPTTGATTTVTGHAQGTVVITATGGGVTGYATVNVIVFSGPF